MSPGMRGCKDSKMATGLPKTYLETGNQDRAVLVDEWTEPLPNQTPHVLRHRAAVNQQIEAPRTKTDFSSRKQGSIVIFISDWHMFNSLISPSCASKHMKNTWRPVILEGGREAFPPIGAESGRSLGGLQLQLRRRGLAPWRWSRFGTWAFALVWRLKPMCAFRETQGLSLHSNASSLSCNLAYLHSSVDPTTQGPIYKKCPSL